MKKSFNITILHLQKTKKCKLYINLEQMVNKNNKVDLLKQNK